MGLQDMQEWEDRFVSACDTIRKKLQKQSDIDGLKQQADQDRAEIGDIKSELESLIENLKASKND